MATFRAVLDTNVVISALIRPGGPPGRILGAAIEGSAVRWVTSRPLLAELQAAFQYPRLRRYLRLSAEGSGAFIVLVEQVADLADLADHPAPGICRDPNDEMCLQTALAGRADCLVTGDSDLLDLGDVEGVSILAPAEFERLLKQV